MYLLSSVGYCHEKLFTTFGKPRCHAGDEVFHFHPSTCVKTRTDAVHAVQPVVLSIAKQCHHMLQYVSELGSQHRGVSSAISISTPDMRFLTFFILVG